MDQRSIIDRVISVIAERKALAPGERSYVRKLLDGGVSAIGAKIHEEASEVVEAAAEPGDAGRTHLVHELADLVFHTLVLMGARDVAWTEVEAELARRFGTSGIDEKAARVPQSEK